MPLEERCARHEELFKVISANDIKFWGERFTGALTQPPAIPVWAEELSA